MDPLCDLGTGMDPSARGQRAGGRHGVKVGAWILESVQTTKCGDLALPRTPEAAEAWKCLLEARARSACLPFPPDKARKCRHCWI